MCLIKDNSFIAILNNQILDCNVVASNVHGNQVVLAANDPIKYSLLLGVGRSNSDWIVCRARVPGPESPQIGSWIDNNVVSWDSLMQGSEQITGYTALDQSSAGRLNEENKKQDRFQHTWIKVSNDLFMVE